MFGRFTVIAALCLSAPAAFAFQAKDAAAPKAPTLKAGDAAPALVIEKWVKGTPVASFEKGKVYVVEFWATWCGPCVHAFPHLSALQQDYKDKGVTIIGTNIWEDKVYSDTTLPKVEKFVEGQGERMGYTVAYDGPGKSMDANYMRAAGRNGIPSAFIVDQKGTIAWVGHPASIDFALGEVVAGKWDVTTGPEREKKVTDQLTSIQKKLKDDPAGAQAEFDKFQSTYPAIARHQDDLKLELLKANGQWDKAVDMAIASKNAMALNAIAWGIVDPDAKLAKRNLEVAMRAATAANEISGGNDPGILDTLARTYFTKGDVKKAIEIETKAVGLAKDAMKADLEKALAEFKAKDSQ